MLTLTRPCNFSSTEQQIVEASTELPFIARIWDLTACDTFRGRTVTDIQGLVGLAHNPVAVIYFSSADHPTRISATYSGFLQHSGEIALRAGNGSGTRG